MNNDEGVRSQNQIQGVDKNGNLRNIKVDENGNLMTTGGTGSIASNGTAVTLEADIIIVGTEAVQLAINKKITKIELANYSETAKLTINTGEKIFKIGSNLAIEIIINSTVDNITITSTEENTEVQYLIEGEE